MKRYRRDDSRIALALKLDLNLSPDVTLLPLVLAAGDILCLAVIFARV
jgi:hypothetical protein